MLIIFSGLPGTGKSTIARALARKLGAVYLRIDTIETALTRDEDHDVGPYGYLTAYALAEDNLKLGQTVVADSVNPITLTRDAWHQVASQAGASSVDIEIICSDVVEHQRRVEARLLTKGGEYQPTWNDVLAREYLPWDTERLVIDTASASADAAVSACIDYCDKAAP